MKRKKRAGPLNQTVSENIKQAVLTISMLIFMLIILFPIFNVVMASFTSQAEYARRGAFILIPEKWDFTAYKLLLNSGSNIWNGYMNTLFRVVVGTAANMFVTLPMSYALSKRYLRGRKTILALVLFSMLFSGGMIPNYLLVDALGLTNTRAALIVPGLVSFWNMIILRNFFDAIPPSLEEAALLDGANRLQILVRVVIPLSKPAIATISLFYSVSHWNSWFDAVLYINDNHLLPIQNIVRNILSSTSALADLDPTAWMELTVPPSTYAMRSATIIIATLPILMVYPFIQKYFVKGVMVGSIKG